MVSNSPPLQIRSAELIGALSHALDLTEGQPRGHCSRVCWMGMKLGEAINMPRYELSLTSKLSMAHCRKPCALC